MNMFNDESNYFIDKGDEATRRSFISTKIISLHSYYYHNYRFNNLKFEGDENLFLTNYQKFLNSLQKTFNQNPELLNYYISFSKISFLTICFMGNFQKRIFFLRSLISLKSNEITFLNLHSSHSEIIYNTFLVLISSVISRRGPPHFFQKEKSDEDFEYIDINDNSQKQELINFIKSQISFFSNECELDKSKIKQFETKIILDSITDNNLLSIPKDIKEILSEIFDNSIDFKPFQKNCIDSPFSQTIFDIIGRNDLFDKIISQINEIINCNQILFQNRSLLYVSNPQFYVVKSFLFKLGRIEKSTNCKHRKSDEDNYYTYDDDENSKNQCTKHHEFIAVDWNSLVPKINLSPKCPYCAINDKPSNLALDITYNNTVPMLYDFEKLNEDTESIMNLSIYDSIDRDDLHPIELHLLRMILIVAKQRIIENDRENSISTTGKNQLAICIASIASLLFPYTSFSISSKITETFIIAVLDKIKLLMTSHYQINRITMLETPTYREVRKIFSSSISPFIKGLFENLSKASANQHLITPMNSKLLLRQFLLDPELREQCPVIYSYLRLNDRFDRIKFISNLVPSLKLILKYSYFKSNSDAFQKSVSEINGIDPNFLDNWREAAKFIERDLLTDEARKCLEDTLADDPVIEAFLPRSHENWPVMTVMLSLSDAQNQFIKTLSRYVDVTIKSVDDFEITTLAETSRDFFRVRNSILNALLMNIISGKLEIDNFGVHCKFDENIEKQFRNELSKYVYYYIIHKSLSLNATFNYNGEGVVSKFRHIVEAKQITNQQLIYLNKLKVDGKGTGLSFLLENLMFKIIGTSSELLIIDGSKFIVEEIHEKLFNTKSGHNYYHPTSIENDAFYAFIDANNRMNDKLTIDQIPSIYEYLNSPFDDAVINELSLGDQLAKAMRDCSFRSESFISAEMDKFSYLPKNSWKDVTNVIALIMAIVQDQNPNLNNIIPKPIFDVYSEIKDSLSADQNNVIQLMAQPFKQFDTTLLSLIYQYCIKKTI